MNLFTLSPYVLTMQCSHWTPRSSSPRGLTKGFVYPLFTLCLLFWGVVLLKCPVAEFLILNQQILGLTAAGLCCLHSSLASNSLFTFCV
jgi:hypothetical protein